MDSLVSNIIFWAGLGTVMGFLARAILPGEQKMNLILTIVIGVVGSLIGALVGRYFMPDQFGKIGLVSLLCALGGSLVTLIIWCLIFKKNWK